MKTRYIFTCKCCKKESLALPSLAMTMGSENRNRWKCKFCKKINDLMIDSEDEKMIQYSPSPLLPQ